ncbi:PI-PLC X domain-containing protein 1-like [Polistes fuscatus]|uniref:PI-PLC X domain-containing protein 1-like n=1 Tax=Polistes fuscatus TaxID=30207 RepID=UPI001CA9C95C|nr:PI-PLC X domain-containing protein 1-like [Polistes fuscatus]XP_043502847.1 PI-PLC X domain-containing protein 1-like [Polistes fuscatus]
MIVSILLYFFMIFGVTTSKTCNSNNGDDFQHSHVSLIISPMMSKSMIRELEIYWNHPKYRSDSDRIALYSNDPTNGLEPIFILEPKSSSGIKNTGIQAEYLPTKNLTYQRQCLKYYVAWLRNGVLRKVNCLKTYPNWMAERKDILGPLRMNKIFLPGTHDSASYAIHKLAAEEDIIDKYVITQDIDVLAQLIYGVRYLDIRVGYYPRTNEIWWGNHGIIRLIPLIVIIEQVKLFLNNTEEIVIFDVQEFPVGFQQNISVHQQFVKYLEEQFADYYLPYRTGWLTTLNTIWSSKRRLIIGYDEKQVLSLYESLWPCVTHQWGNVQTIDDLYRYLNRIETSNARDYKITPRSAMAELTPNVWDVIWNRLGGLRQMADRVNANVTNWYATKWQHTANIVAVDFVRSSGIVETSIEWNDRRNSNC